TYLHHLHSCPTRRSSDLTLAGGPANGFRYLADSNVDWGQDLPALRAAFERVGARRPLLSYFGSAPLNAYGVTADPWLSGDQAERSEEHTSELQSPYDLVC